MEEKIYRGKDATGIVNFIWVYGELHGTDETDTQLPAISYFDRFYNSMFIAVRPQTVGLYAGITDKNGTPIYEGDIVNATVWSNGDLLAYTAVVERTESGFFLKSISSPVSHSICGISKTRSEVIGNIYDNPEYCGGNTNDILKSG